MGTGFHLTGGEHRRQPVLSILSQAAMALCLSIRRWVFGTVIKLQAQVLMQRGGRLDEDLNDRIEKVWKYWGYKSYCDVAGRLCFADSRRLSCLCRGNPKKIPQKEKPYESCNETWAGIC